MTASCSNLVLTDPGRVDFIATSYTMPSVESCQMPRFTTPKCPRPSEAVVLKTHNVHVCVHVKHVMCTCQKCVCVCVCVCALNFLWLLWCILNGFPGNDLDLLMFQLRKKIFISRGRLGILLFILELQQILKIQLITSPKHYCHFHSRSIIGHVK